MRKVRNMDCGVRNEEKILLTYYNFKFPIVIFR